MEKTPNKMIGGIAGAMAQQQGVLEGATSLISQPQPGAASVATQQPPSAFKPNAVSAAQAMYGGMQAPGTSFRMEDDSPLDQNAFIGALEAAKASGEKSFNVNGKTYPVK